MTRVAARTVRVGLVADSHVGEYLDALPEWVFDALSDCDLILHAGDLSVVGVLGELEEIAPVRAVRGDHDRDADAPARIAGRQRARLADRADPRVVGPRLGRGDGRPARRWCGDRSWQRRLDVELRNRLGAVDAIVYGHWHIPRIADYGPTLMVCPGAVCPGGALAEGDPVPRSLHAPIDVAVRRFRRAMHPEQYRPDGRGARGGIIRAPSAPHHGSRPIDQPVRDDAWTT